MTHQPTNPLTGVKFRATSIAKNLIKSEIDVSWFGLSDPKYIFWKQQISLALSLEKFVANRSRHVIFLWLKTIYMHPVSECTNVLRRSNTCFWCFWVNFVSPLANLILEWLQGITWIQLRHITTAVAHLETHSFDKVHLKMKTTRKAKRRTS